MIYKIRRDWLRNPMIVRTYWDIYDYLERHGYSYDWFRGKKHLTYQKFEETLEDKLKLEYSNIELIIIDLKDRLELEYSNIEWIIIDTEKKTYKFWDTYKKDCKLDDLPWRNDCVESKWYKQATQESKGFPRLKNIN